MSPHVIRRISPLLLLLLLLCAYNVTAQTLVDCPVDCDVTPDVAAEIEACLVAQATLCNTEVRVIPRVLWESELGITNASLVNATHPTNLTYLPTNESVPRVSCEGLVFTEAIGNEFFFICVETTFCYIDPLAEVTSVLNGSCAASMLAAPGIASIYYLGPATIVGGGFVVSRDWQTQITFEQIVWNGGGTSDQLLADCALNSNLTMLNVNITGFVGEYAFKAEACTYDVWVTLDNVLMQDVPGTALYFEGLFGFVLLNFRCERCAQRNNSECVHIMMSKASRAVLDIENPSCFRIADLLPPRCRYCLTGEDGFCGSRCNEGEVQVYDRIATESMGSCPTIDFAFTDYFTMLPMMMPEFDPVCRVWSPPLCNFLTVINSQNFSQEFPFAGGDIIWDFDAPLICVPGGDISPLTGPFFITQFDNNLGDPVPLTALPPLPTPPAFVDPSFEEFGVLWNQTVSAPDVVIAGPPTFSIPINQDVITDSAPQPARTGSWLMRCDNHAVKGVHQTVQAAAGDVGNVRTLEFWGRRRSGEQFHYTSRFVQLLIDGVEQDRVDEPTFSNTMVTSGIYYMFTLDWTPADTAVHTLSLVCDFSGGVLLDFVTFHIDDLAWQAPWAGTPVLDPSFEPHSLSWTDSPVGGAILHESDTPCPPRTGDYVFQCGEQGSLRSAKQSVTFTEDGVYTVAFHAQRRNSLSGYVGMSVSIVSNILLASTPVDATHFPNDDTYYPLFGEGGGFVVSGAPVTMDLGFECDFTGAPGTANLCIDDVSIVAVGTSGVMGSTLGFSSQTISSEPEIVNTTCDCSNFTAPAVNSTEVPCAYTINPNDTVCVETVPYCCVSDYLPQFLLVPHIMAANCSCTDLNADPPCVFLVDCNTTVGDVRHCREFTCPFNATYGSLPFDALADAFHYLLENCTENTAVLLNYTDSLLYPNGSVTDGGNWVALYSPKPECGVLNFAEAPTAFYQVCPLADVDSCLVYAFCDPSIQFDEDTGAYTVLNCTQLNCTNLGVSIITMESQFALCAVLATNVTLTDVDGGWSFTRGNDSAILFSESALLFYLEALAENCGNTPIEFFELPSDQAALAPGCGPPAYFRLCPCCPQNETFTVPANSSNPEQVLPDDFYTCTNGAPSCRCNNAALEASNPPPENSTAYHIVLAPDTLSLYRFINARAQQYMYGVRIDQVNYELVERNSIVVPHFYDDRAICRLTIRNDNEFCWGSEASGGGDCIQGNPGGPYSRICNILNKPGPGPRLECLWTYGQFKLIKTELDCNCLVDDRALEGTPGFGTTIFNSISDALAGCAKDIICVRFSTKSAYFEENLVIEKTNKKIVLVTLEGAIVVGTHEIRTNADNVTLIGFRWVHPADNQRPLFSVVKGGDESDLEQFNILNCIMDGSGCRKCGVVDTKRINDYLMNYTRLNDWQFFAVKLDDVEQLTIAGCVFNATVGRSLLIKYKQGFIIDELAFPDGRGGEDLKGAAITSLTAKNDEACDGSNKRHECLFRYVVQHVRTTEEVPRFRDVCYYFARGAFNITGRLYDVVCRLAQDGVVFLKTPNIGAGQLVELTEANPMNRPSLFHLLGQPMGHDWVLRSAGGAVSNEGDVFFNFNDDVSTNYDDAPFTLPFDLRCETNANWDLRFAFGQQVQLPRHGALRFHNTSILLEFCYDRRVAGWFDPLRPDSLAFIGYVRVFNGSKIVPDRLTVSRDAYLIGDDVDACCTVNAVIEGLGHRIHTERLNMTDLTFTMPPEPEDMDMWSSGPSEYDPEQLSAEDAFSQTIPAEIMLLRVYADGREILPLRKMWAFNLLVGVKQPPKFFRDITNKLPPPTYVRVELVDTLITSFLALNEETAPDDFNFVEAEYPVTNGFHVQCFNRLNSTSVFSAYNLTVRDVDSHGLEAFFFNNYTVSNSSFFNCSGRALGNEACVNLQGNDVSKLVASTNKFNATEFFLETPCHMFFLNNTCLQTNTVLFPRDNRGSQPGWCACYQFMGFPSTCEYCVMNGSTKGLPLAMREDETLNTTINQCPLYTEPAPVAWPDLARYLRGQCLAGHLEAFSGTQHDLGFGHKTTDMFGETYFCDSLDQFSCCLLLDPPECYVTQSAQLLEPSSPWLGQFVFASLSDAIVDCNATTRTIVVLGSEDLFRIGDYTEKVYTEVISATVPVVSVRGLKGPLLIIASKGVTWRSVGNSLNTQCVTVTLRDFVFDHDGTVAAAIWDQPAPGDGSCGLHLYNNFWNVTADGWAIRAYAGDSFWVSHNAVRGHSVTRRAIEVRGNGTCSDRDVRVVHNEVRHVLGVGVDVLDLSCPIVSFNNLQDVGGQDGATAIPYALHVSPCTAAVPLSKECIVIHRNFVRGTQVVSAIVGLTATCWFDPVPLGQKRVRITDNDCNGLEIGIRFDNMPDTSPSGDPKAQLRGFCSADANGLSHGLPLPPLNRRFDLVRGPPASDASLVTDPNSPANKGRWCTDCCPRFTSILFWTLIGVLGLIAAVLLGMCLVTGCCTPRELLPPTVRIIRWRPTNPFDPYTERTWTPFYDDLSSAAVPSAATTAVASIGAQQLTKRINLSGLARRVVVATPATMMSSEAHSPPSASTSHASVNNNSTTNDGAGGDFSEYLQL